MQVYKAPLKDYKFLIKDFLNSSLSETVLKNSETDNRRSRYDFRRSRKIM